MGTSPSDPPSLADSVFLSLSLSIYISIYLVYSTFSYVFFQRRYNRLSALYENMSVFLSFLLPVLSLLFLPFLSLLLSPLFPSLSFFLLNPFNPTLFPLLQETDFPLAFTSHITISYALAGFRYGIFRDT